ncbi:hypothetical protein APG31_12605 [Listeria monocytogenes]|nr:hypothetical protein [Listeria monocytogenes]
MKRVGFYFIDTDDDATSFCPSCGEPDTSVKTLAVLESIDVNKPVYIRCARCKLWYNIGGDVEEGG